MTSPDDATAATTLQQLKEIVGLDDKNATDLASKPERAKSVLTFFAANGIDKEGAREVKVMLFNLWTKVKAETHRDLLARMIKETKLQTTQQVDAAVRFVNALKPEAEVNLGALEAECGVGVYVSEAETAQHVAAALRQEDAKSLKEAWEKNPNMMLGKMRRLPALRWAEVSFIKAALDAQVPPLIAHVKLDPQAAKKTSPATGTAGQPAKENGNARKVCPRSEDYVALGQGLPRTPIGELTQAAEGSTVYLVGWAHRVRHQARLSFVVLRDGSGYVQCVFDGEVDEFHRETALAVRGVVRAEPKARTELQPALEVHVAEYAIIGLSDGSIETIITAESSIDKLLDQRHIVLRGTNATATMKVRHELLRAFREYFWSKHYYEVTPPTLVQTQCEGGSTIFDVLYYNDKAYLTQSSQLYLETVTASLGNVYCCMPSYRAEKSKTKRHLSEFTHLEVEYDVCTFEEFLTRLEEMICNVIHTVLARAGDLVALLNPDQVIDLKGDLFDPANFKFAPRAPFQRLRYADAIKFCNDNGILNTETGKPFEYGEDITEKPERAMVAKIGNFVLLTHFPAEMKSFYMQRDPQDNSLTESVDVLAPGVGEIVGGSMRMWKYDEILAAYTTKGIDPTNYYWYTDQRKYGGAPHGGFGLGVERLLVWLLNLDSVKDACQFPRYMGRCTP